MDRARTLALVAAAYLGTFLATLDISIVNVALPTLQAAFQTDLAALQWVVNAYAIALSALMLSAGTLGDRYGHKKVWLGSVLLFVMGSLACAAAEKLDMLLWGRAIQGVAGALLIPGAMPILTHAFPESRQRAKVIGGWSAFSALALISGPLLGGLLVEHVGWRSVFLVNAPLGILAAGLGAWAIPERKHPEHAAFDPLGQLLSMAWLGLLSYGLIEMGERGAAWDKFAMPLFLAAAGLMAFIWVERHVSRPLLPLQLFSNPAFALANVASFALGFSGYSSLFFLSLYLQQSHGSSPAQAGWQLMPQFVVMGAASMVFGRLAARFPLKSLMAAGYGLIGAALCLMFGFTPHTAQWEIAAVLMVLGLGMGLAVPATGMSVMELAPHERSGIASAAMNALRQGGMTLGIALLGSMMNLQAMRSMEQALIANGMAGAADLAKTVVAKPVFSTGQAGMVEAYRLAMASGFSCAMLGAGSVCLLCAFVLLLQGLWNKQEKRLNGSAQA